MGAHKQNKYYPSIANQKNEHFKITPMPKHIEVNSNVARYIKPCIVIIIREKRTNNENG
jgi:hypothetical protein